MLSSFSPGAFAVARHHCLTWGETLETRRWGGDEESPAM